jgi:hypothetical protein
LDAALCACNDVLLTLRWRCSPCPDFARRHRFDPGHRTRPVRFIELARRQGNARRPNRRARLGGHVQRSRNIYYAVPDRGPADGATTYQDRLYTLEIEVTKTALNAYKIDSRVTRTQLLRTKEGIFTGSAAAFDAINSSAGLRFDPEGLRVSACGESVYVSDEYGPLVYEFRIASGKRVRSLGVPNKFLIDLPSANANDELTKNVAGRQSNRGMEGLAISPDGTKPYGIMQSALIQDGALDAGNMRNRLE